MVHEHTNILVALAGQPNCGKSTIFNMLTGEHQHIANFPGVTVESKVGRYRDSDFRYEVVDLPGTYSLSSYSPEERVARDFLLLEKPEVLVVVADASNLRRHLYLALQLREMNQPMVLCLNMMDVAKRRSIEIDAEKISQMLDVPVVITSARRGEGGKELKAEINRVASKKGHEVRAWKLDYGEELEAVLVELERELESHPHLTEEFPVRWLALRLLEKEARRIVQHHTHDDSWRELLDKARELREGFPGGEEEISRSVSAARCCYAGRVECACVDSSRAKKRTVTDYFDLFACHGVLGYLLAGVVIYLMFDLTFKLADSWEWIPWTEGSWTTPVGVFGWFFDDFLADWAGRLVYGASPVVQSLVNDGVVAGIGGVMGFVPIIFFMFIFLAVIEDSGYIARIAYMFDRILRLFGLQGQSVLPMIVSGGIMGGCAVPGIMATRVMRDPKEKILTMMVAPMMNCGAKIPVYILLTAAFFASNKSWVMFSLVLISWAMALIAALILSRTVIKGEQAPFLMELPNYHVPTLSSIWRSARNRTWLYARKAGTIILAVNILIWAMMYFPRYQSDEIDQQRVDIEHQFAEGSEERTQKLQDLDNSSKKLQLENSVAGLAGRALTPLSQFAGFNWQDNVALVGGFAAKEVVVSTLATAYSMGEVEAEVEEGVHPLVPVLQQADGWSPLKAFAMIIFVMIYAPCMPTVAVIWRESGSWRWALFSTLFTTVLAFVVAVLVYQIGLLF